MWRDKTVSVVLPTYNEKDSIRHCIEKLYSTGYVDEVIVVNNNAVEGTTDEVKKTKAKILFEERQGYGYSCRKGLSEAKGDLVILFEPDGTFSPDDVVKLLAYSEQFDAVFGTRTSGTLIWSGANMGLFLRIGNIAVAKMVEFLFNTTLMTDVGCTFKLFKKEVLLTLKPQFQVGGSHFGIEMILLTIKNGFRFIEIPVNYMERVGISSVTGSFWKAFILGMTMIWNILVFRIKTLGAIQRPLQIGTYDDISIENILKCPNCSIDTNKNQNKVYSKDPDGISNLNYTLCNCETCGIYYTPFKPSGKNLDKFYFSGYHGEKKPSSWIVKVFRQIEKLFLNSKLKKIEKHCRRKGSILDIGCGDGRFVKYANKKGWDASGVDPNFQKKDKMGTNSIFFNSLKNKKVKSKKYDAITLWHVFEHMDRKETDKVLKFAKKHLKMNGILFIATPNIESIQSKLGKGKWFHLDLPRHQIFYTDNAIKHYLSKNKLIIKEINHFSMEYELAGWVQTILNMTGAETNYLYKLLKRAKRDMCSSGLKKCYSILITFILSPFLFPFFFILSFLSGNSKYGAVQEVYAIKEGNEK